MKEIVEFQGVSSCPAPAAPLSLHPPPTYTPKHFPVIFFQQYTSESLFSKYLQCIYIEKFSEPLIFAAPPHLTFCPGIECMMVYFNGTNL